MEFIEYNKSVHFVFTIKPDRKKKKYRINYNTKRVQNTARHDKRCFTRKDTTFGFWKSQLGISSFKNPKISVLRRVTLTRTHAIVW